jgi:hypothetical protein
MESAKTAILVMTANDTFPLLHPRSELIGLIMTPMENWAPELKNNIKNDAANTSQL